MTTAQDILNHRKAGPWRQLESIAQTLAAQAKDHGGAFFAPRLGGGTRLMLALNHRISDDVDLFVDSPAWLPYVSPRLNGTFENEISSYTEDGDHVKMRFPFGEIDFIVRTPLLQNNDLWNPAAQETQFELEPPLEVLAKKLFYRGWALTPRDLFDWQVVEERAQIADSHREELATVLLSKLDEVEASLERMRSLKIARPVWKAIKAPNVPELERAVEWGLGAVHLYRTLCMPKETKKPFSKPH